VIRLIRTQVNTTVARMRIIEIAEIMEMALEVCAAKRA
jgi:hypothetical protein